MIMPIQGPPSQEEQKERIQAFLKATRTFLEDLKAKEELPPMWEVILARFCAEEYNRSACEHEMAILFPPTEEEED